MPSNHTTNYQLSQWERTDKVQMEDFNADNAKLDAALGALAEAQAALEAKCGNITIGIFTYTGNGVFTSPTLITFPKLPTFFIIYGPSIMMGRGGATLAAISYETGSYAHTGFADVTWSGNTLSIKYGNQNPGRQMNENAALYTVIGFYAKE